MSNQLAVQIYSLRQQMKDDFVGTMHRLAEIGYSAVETAGIPETVSATAAGKLFNDLELQVCSAHLPLPLGENKSQVIDVAGSFGCRRIVTASLKAEEYAGKDRIRATCDLLNEAHVIAKENDLIL